MENKKIKTALMIVGIIAIILLLVAEVGGIIWYAGEILKALRG